MLSQYSRIAGQATWWRLLINSPRFAAAVAAATAATTATATATAAAATAPMLNFVEQVNVINKFEALEKG